MEEQLPAGLGERQVAEFVEDDEVHAGEIIGDPALAPGAGFGFEPVDEIDGGEEAPAGAGADAVARDGDGKMAFAGPGSPYQHGVALLGEKARRRRARAPAPR